ncbi:hypothetical protein M8C21_031548, partial [Ambrosia artemisiifolia]
QTTTFTKDNNRRFFFSFSFNQHLQFSSIHQSINQSIPIHTCFLEMASSSDPWNREYSEASKLADDITNMISER